MRAFDESPFYHTWDGFRWDGFGWQDLHWAWRRFFSYLGGGLKRWLKRRMRMRMRTNNIDMGIGIGIA